jgi:electron transfer flavoprotein-quinone oxidoreductase
VTIVADGANSRLTLGTPIRPAPRLGEGATELGVKEVYRLDASRIEERFQLAPGEAHAEEWVLGLYEPGVMAGGFLYTNRDTVSLGVIVRVASLFGGRTAAHDLVETFKQHPTIQRAIAGGELVEYGAKLISSGWASRPAAFHGDGWLVAGDAAGFVFSNGLVIQGMNYAVRSGLEAAEAALAAREARDPSAARLAEYDRRLEATGLLADFRDFEGMDRVKWNSRFYTFYPRFATELFGGLMGAAGGPKEHLRRAVRKAQRAVGLRTGAMVRDALEMIREL